MKLIGLSIWLLFLVAGVGIYVFAPQTLEPIVCYPGESIQTDGEYSSGLYCDDNSGHVREASQSIVLPFIFFMIVTPIFISFVILLNKSTSQQDIINPVDMTWKKRFTALFTAILTLAGMLVYIIDPPHEYNISIAYGEAWKEIKAKWGYFLGNSQPLIELYAELDARTEARKN